MKSPTRILIVDDSALYRQTIQNVLRNLSDVEVVGTAKNGVEAIEKIENLAPELLTLDVQMPDMDGIGVLNEIKRRGLSAKAIMVSGYTSEGAQVTTDALLEGAFDFILKPSGGDPQANRQNLHDELESKIIAFRDSASSLTSRSSDGAVTDSVTGDSTLLFSTAASHCCAVIIGTSTGGPAALKTVLPTLPRELPVPVFVIQHMPPKYTHSLAKRLDQICDLSVVEGETGMRTGAGQIVVAPGGKQLKLLADGDQLVIQLTDDPPENAVRPSVDYVLRSAANILNGNLLAVIMTGMGRDGLDGCRRVKQSGGVVFAQRQDDCVVYGMPKAIIDADLADRTSLVQDGKGDYSARQ